MSIFCNESYLTFKEKEPKISHINTNQQNALSARFPRESATRKNVSERCQHKCAEQSLENKQRSIR